MKSVINIILSFIVGSYFLYQHFTFRTVPPIKTINAVVKSYQFNVYSSYHRSGLKDYLIRVEDDNCIFRIGPEEWWMFEKSKFEESVSKGDSIKLDVSLKSFNECGANYSTVEILGISDKERVYLDKAAVLRERRAPTYLLISIAFFLLSAFLYVMKKRKLNF